jgi:HpaII restriction endonuclease
MTQKPQTKTILKANKGEWAEFYTHLKIISDRSIPKGDSKLEPVDGSVYPVLAIYKNIDSSICRVFDLSGSDSFEVKNENSNEVSRFPTDIVKSKVATIFEKILLGSDEEHGAFGIVEASEIAETIQLPVKNQLREKADISLLIEDFNTNTQQKSGFSIKSKFTANPTLLNASKSTRLSFEIKGLGELNIQEINNIDGSSKVRDRIKKITDLGGGFIPTIVRSDQFQTNLKYFDSQFESIIGSMLILAYSGSKNLKEILESPEFIKTLIELDITQEQCTEKVKDFLLAFALGMEPKKPYTGLDDLNGGILWVKNDGSIVCHHVFERKDLKQYLYDNTFFESPSTGRHEYGFVYEKDEKLFLDLCMQIRFK